MSTIIGLGFKARSGKDTVAGILEKRFGFHRLAFADPLKAAARELFGLDLSQLHGERKEVQDEFWGVTPRNLLQRLGTEAMRREFGDDFWIRAARRRIDTTTQNVGRPWAWVVTDVRFRNEAEAIKAWGGVVWRVDRPGAGANGGVARHPSETELEEWDGWDAIVENAGTLDDLEKRVIGMAMGAFRRTVDGPR
jgi:hypothetical protein